MRFKSGDKAIYMGVRVTVLGASEHFDGAITILFENAGVKSWVKEAELEHLPALEQLAEAADGS